MEWVWCALQGRDGCPLRGCPLAVFQGGQILFPASECVVSTGASQEHLATLAAPWGHPNPFLPSIMTNQTYRPLQERRPFRQNPYNFHTVLFGAQPQSQILAHAGWVITSALPPL